MAHSAEGMTINDVVVTQLNTSDTIVKAIEETTAAINDYRPIVNKIETNAEETTKAIKDDTKKSNKWIVGLKDAVVDKLKTMNRNLSSFISSMWSDISSPIKDLLTLIMNVGTSIVFVGTTLWKVWKWLRGKKKDGEEKKSDWKSILGMAGAALGLGVGLIWAKIKGPMLVIGNGLAWFGGLFKKGGTIARLGTWFRELSVTTKVLPAMTSIGSGIGKLVAFLSKVPILGKLLSGFKIGFGWAQKLFKPLQMLLSTLDFIDGYMNTEGDISEKVMGGVRGLFTGLVKSFTEPIEMILEWMGIESNGLTDKVMGVVLPIFTILFSSVYDFSKGFAEGPDGFINSVKSGFKRMFGGIKDTLFSLINAIGKIFNVDNLMGEISKLVDNIPFISDKTKQKIKASMSPSGTAPPGSNQTANKQSWKDELGSFFGGNKDTSPSTSTTVSSGVSSGGSSSGGGGGSTTVSPSSTSVSSPGTSSSMGGGAVSSPMYSGDSGSSGYTVSDEAKKWFTDMASTQSLLREYLKKTMDTSGSNVVVNNNNSSSGGSGNNYTEQSDVFTRWRTTIFGI